jgi:two-component system, chemotaxis family, response regulator Rcp1
MLSQSNVQPMEILLVEDGWTDARMTIFAIRQSGVHHRLSLVRTLDEAKRFLRQEGIFAQAPPVSLMLLDMMLPDGTGIELLDEINSWDTPTRPTTVVLTASDSPEMRSQCLARGVIDFIPKPVRDEEFMRVVRDHKRFIVAATVEAL